MNRAIEEITIAADGRRLSRRIKLPPRVGCRGMPFTTRPRQAKSRRCLDLTRKTRSGPSEFEREHVPADLGSPRRLDHALGVTFRNLGEREAFEHPDVAHGLSIEVGGGR